MHLLRCVHTIQVQQLPLLLKYGGTCKSGGSATAFACKICVDDGLSSLKRNLELKAKDASFFVEEQAYDLWRTTEFDPQWED